MASCAVDSAVGAQLWGMKQNGTQLHHFAWKTVSGQRRIGDQRARYR